MRFLASWIETGGFAAAPAATHPSLRRLGFLGSDVEIISQAYHENRRCWRRATAAQHVGRERRHHFTSPDTRDSACMSRPRI